MDAQMPFRFLLRLLDGYRLNMPTKGGFIWGEHTTVILTSNTAPDRWYNDNMGANSWSFDTNVVSAGPLQRRINSIHTGTGVYPNVVWDVPLPVRVPDEIHPIVPRDIELQQQQPEVVPDSGAAPDDPVMIDVGDVPGAAFAPTTPGFLAEVGLNLDEFLTMD